MKTGAAWGVTVDADGGVIVQAPDGYMIRDLRLHMPGFGVSSTVYYAAGVAFERAPQSDDEMTTLASGSNGKIVTTGGVRGALPSMNSAQIWLPGAVRFVALYANGMGGSPHRVALAGELVPVGDVCGC